MSTSRKDLRRITVVEPHSKNITTQDACAPLFPVSRIPQQAESDEQLIQLWLHGRSSHTIKGYLNDIKLFRHRISKSLRTVTLQDLQDFADHIAEKNYAPATMKRILCAVKSLFGFGHRIGYLPFDTGKPLRIPTPKETLSERILSEGEVEFMIENTKKPRDILLLKVLYYTGLRVSEVSSLKWSDFQAREKTGQLTVQTKGDKTNVILLPAHLWAHLMEYRNDAPDEAPVFRSRKGGHLCVGQIQRIVKKVAEEAGVSGNVSPHWFRHSHASHALDNGCPIHLVQKQLNHSNLSVTGKYLHCRPQESSSKYLK